MSPLPESVQAAIARGESVLPLDLDKRPMVEEWKSLQDRVPPVEEVEAWARSLCPAAWATVTGHRSGLVVLDFDGEEGIAWLRRLGLEPHVRTGSGGFHVRLQHPGWRVKTLNSKAKKELGERWPGVDIRACGGYAAFAGRNRSGEYTKLRDPADLVVLDALPADLRAFLGLLEPPSPEKAAANGAARVRGAHVPASVLIERALGEAVASGRNNGGFWLAVQLRDNGFDRAEAQSAMLDYRDRTGPTNTKGVLEPYTDADALASLEEAYTRPAREPWRAHSAPTLHRLEFKVTIDNGKLVLPPTPAVDDVAGLCGWLTAVFNLDLEHPITGGAREGLRGPDGHVVLARAGAPPLRFEPATAINQPARLIEALSWRMLPTDGAVHAFKGDHCRQIAYVVRMLCAAAGSISDAQETGAIIGTFLQGAVHVEGHTTYGGSGQRYEAARALRREVDERTGRSVGQPHYLIDTNTGELVIAVSDLADATRRHTGGSVRRGWLDARMESLGWARVRLDGHALPGRSGRQGPHAAVTAYRGLLPHGDGDVTT